MTQNEFIHRYTLDQHFTVQARSTAQDHRLSWAARGLLGYLLSLPKTWKLNRKHLASLYQGSNQKGNGATAIDSMIEELIQYGYIRYIKDKDDQGRFQHIYHIFPVPYDDYQKMFPEGGYPGMGLTRLVKPPPIERIERKEMIEEEMSVVAQCATGREANASIAQQGVRCRKETSPKPDIKPQEIDEATVYAVALRKRPDIAPTELKDALKVLANYSGKVHDWWRFLEGTVENQRKQKISRRITKKKGLKRCRVKNTLETGSRKVSEESTSTQTSQKCMSFLEMLLWPSADLPIG